MSSLSLTRTAPLMPTDRQVYRMMVAATYPFFFVSVLVRRLVSDRPGRTTERRSVVSEAWETGSSTLLFAFMG